MQQMQIITIDRMYCEKGSQRLSILYRNIARMGQKMKQGYMKDWKSLEGAAISPISFYSYVGLDILIMN